MSKKSALVAPSSSTPSITPSLMPFHIAYSGPAPISTYMMVHPHQSSTPEAPVYQSSFRGRLLVGQDLKVPEGYQGVVWEAPPASSSQQWTRQAVVASKPRPAPPAGVYNAPVVMEDSSGLRRSPRKRPAPAVAAKPPAKKLHVGKFKMDSDDSDSDDDEENGEVVTAELEVEVETAAVVMNSESTPAVEAVSIELEESTEAFSVPLVPLPASSIAALPDLTHSLATSSASSSILTPTATSITFLSTTTSTDDDNEEAEEEDIYDRNERVDVRQLKPLAAFDKIKVWTTDDPVVKGQDEFFRGLSEWVKLTEAIHDDDD